MKRYLTRVLLIFFTAISSLTYACNGFTPAVTSNTYIGNGEYLLTIDVCEWVSNGVGSEINGLMITVNGATILNNLTPSLYSVSQNLTIYPTQLSPNQIEYGDWGNNSAPTFLDVGDPQACWTIELVVNSSAASVSVQGSSSNAATAPGSGMVWVNGAWGCSSTITVPPATCNSSWTPPSLCSGSSPIDLDNTTPGTGVFSGTGVNSATGVFNPTGLTGNIPITFTVGDALFNCSTTQNIQIIDITPPNLQDESVCVGNTVQLDATVGTPPPPPPPPPATPCTLSIRLYDTFGDGWNGGSVTILVGGVPVLSNITLSSGYGPVTYNFSVYQGQTIVVQYSAGSWSSENYYTVFNGPNATGGSLYASTMYSTPPASQNITNNCSGGIPGGGGGGSGCDYTLLLTDSYGDGWNGADVDIYINGVVYQLNALVINCGGLPCQNSINLPVQDGDIITLFYTGGAWDSENTIYMYDSDNNLVGSVNNPPDGWLGGGITVSCPQPTYTYSWSPSTGLSDPNIANPIANTATTTTYTVTISSPELGCTSTFDAIVTIDPCGLPVELSDFSASCDGNTTVLNWETSSEHNNDYFDVEVAGSDLEFEAIGQVDGAGNSSSARFYTYKVEGADDLQYFRLRQVDFNGEFEFSDVISISCYEEILHIIVERERIFINTEDDVDQLEIYDNSGRLIYDRATKHVDLNHFSSGIYLLKVEINGKVYVKRFFKQ